MTWWLWTLVWVLLVVGAAVLLVRLGLGVFRRGTALLVEVGRAGEVAGALNEQVARLHEQDERPAPAPVLSDPVQLRRERNQRLAQRNRTRRRGYARGRRRSML